jgi:hypothetical protein
LRIKLELRKDLQEQTHARNTIILASESKRGPEQFLKRHNAALDEHREDFGFDDREDGAANALGPGV